MTEQNPFTCRCERTEAGAVEGQLELLNVQC
jgi:hypothetical protein